MTQATKVVDTREEGELCFKFGSVDLPSADIEGRIAPPLNRQQAVLEQPADVPRVEKSAVEMAGFLARDGIFVARTDEIRLDPDQPWFAGRHRLARGIDNIDHNRLADITDGAGMPVDQAAVADRDAAGFG